MPTTILVVDDDPEIRALFRMCLELGGLKVLTAKSVLTALDVFASGVHIDAMMTDYRLGDGFGPDIVGAVGPRAAKVNILVTGYRLLNEEYPGFDLLLQKPIDCATMSNLIRTHLLRKEAQL